MPSKLGMASRASSPVAGAAPELRQLADGSWILIVGGTATVPPAAAQADLVGIYAGSKNFRVGPKPDGTSCTGVRCVEYDAADIQACWPELAALPRGYWKRHQTVPAFQLAADAPPPPPPPALPSTAAEALASPLPAVAVKGSRWPRKATGGMLPQ